MPGKLLVIVGVSGVGAAAGHLQAEGVEVVVPHNRTTLVKRYPQGPGVCTERSRSTRTEQSRSIAANVDAPFIVSDCSDMII